MMQNFGIQRCSLVLQGCKSQPLFGTFISLDNNQQNQEPSFFADFLIDSKGALTDDVQLSQPKNRLISLPVHEDGHDLLLFSNQNLLQTNLQTNS